MSRERLSSIDTLMLRVDNPASPNMIIGLMVLGAPIPRDRLQELHILLFEDLPVIPLWQLVDHFACHRGVQGIRQRPVFLYENVEQLRVVPPLPGD